VTDIVGEISAASVEQSTGIEEINRAVSQMDESTQQNAALVEQAAARLRRACRSRLQGWRRHQHLQAGARRERSAGRAGQAGQRQQRCVQRRWSSLRSAASCG
jgi:hypothetical protein